MSKFKKESFIKFQNYKFFLCKISFVNITFSVNITLSKIVSVYIILF